MARCGACNSTILFGGTQWAAWELCSDDCAVRLKQRLATKYLPAELIKTEAVTLHQSKCIVCSGEGPNESYRTWTVTGMILAVQWGKKTHICCRSCARSAKIKAFLHCLCLGWWSPKALITNIVYLPFNFIAIFFVPATKEPSKQLTAFVGQLLVEKNIESIVSTMRKIG